MAESFQEYTPQQRRLLLENILANTVTLISTGLYEIERSIESEINQRYTREQLGHLAYEVAEVRQFFAAERENTVTERDLSRAFQLRGRVYTLLNQTEEAVPDLNQALILDALNQPASRARGLAYFWLGHYELALQDLTRAIELRPTDPLAFYDRGNVLSATGHYQASLADYNQAIALEPKNVYIWISQAIALTRLELYSSARQTLQSQLHLHPNNPDLYFYLATVYTAEKRYRAAIKELNQAIKLDPNYAKAYHLRGLNYQAILQASRALKNYTQTIELAPANYYYIATRAQYYYLYSRTQQALEDCERCLALNPEYAPAYNLKGLTYIKKGKPEEARAALALASIIDPVSVTEVVSLFRHTRPVSTKYLLLVVAAQLLFISLSNWLFTPDWLQPFFQQGIVTSPQLKPVLSVIYALISLAFTLGLVFGVTKLKPAQLGIKWKGIGFAFLFLGPIWGLIQLQNYIDSCRCGPARLDLSWTRDGSVVVFASFIFYTLAIALAQEIFFRGFLLPQICFKLKGPWRYTNGVLISQAIFVVAYLPLILLNNDYRSNLGSHLFWLFLSEIMLALVYLWTSNLLLTIGLNALLLNPLPIYEPGGENRAKIIFLIMLLINIWAQIEATKPLIRAGVGGIGPIVSDVLDEGYKALPSLMLFYERFLLGFLFILYGVSGWNENSTLSVVELALLTLLIVAEGWWYLFYNPGRPSRILPDTQNNRH